MWIDPDSPARSTIIGTNKSGSLLVYDLAGHLLQTLAKGRPNNVDTARLPDGSTIVFATDRSDNSVGVFTMAPDRTLHAVPGAAIATGLDEVYGLCALSTRDGVTVVVGSKRGQVRFFELRAAGGAWSNRQTREFWVGGQVEGMVADTDHGAVYIGEEKVGLWRYPLDPSSKPSRRLVDTVGLAGGGPGHLAADVEGVTLYDAGMGGAGSWCPARARTDTRSTTGARWRTRVRSPCVWRSRGRRRTRSPTPTAFSPSRRALGPEFPEGVFIAQDDNDGVNQNFKVADWADIARALHLVVDDAGEKTAK